MNKKSREQPDMPIRIIDRRKHRYALPKTNGLLPVPGGSPLPAVSKVGKSHQKNEYVYSDFKLPVFDLPFTIKPTKHRFRQSIDLNVTQGRKKT